VKAFINKKQSVFIAPLVVLAYEHYEKAIERFRWLWMKIAVVTRMESAQKIETVLQWLSDKEKIKKLKTSIDILSMSATPIPRSLNMALSQIRQISIIKTPPQGRQDINTIISKFSERVILDWCEAEFERWWQVYFVHNRVQTLVHFEKVLQWLFPDKKIVITHGQLPWNMLEKRIIDFKNKKYDILLTTTVIENWIDFPNVNTIFINEAQNFGISQIHQLRWRVWRSDRLGHCYLLYKKENLWSDTAKRLKTIDNTSDKKKKSPPTLTNTKIDLQLNIWIPDHYFDSDLDKINFYREIESLTHEEDLENVINDFKVENNVGELNPLPEEMKNFFMLLKVKLQSGKHSITQIKKVWINYQIDFKENISIEELKEFLDLDKEVKFVVTSTTRLRSPVKHFTNTQFFLQYLLNLFNKKVWRKKIKLKS